MYRAMALSITGGILNIFCFQFFSFSILLSVSAVSVAWGDHVYTRPSVSR